MVKFENGIYVDCRHIFAPATITIVENGEKIADLQIKHPDLPLTVACLAYTRNLLQVYLYGNYFYTKKFKSEIERVSLENYCNSSVHINLVK